MPVLIRPTDCPPPSPLSHQAVVDAITESRARVAAGSDLLLHRVAAAWESFLAQPALASLRGGLAPAVDAAMVGGARGPLWGREKGGLGGRW